MIPKLGSDPGAGFPPVEMAQAQPRGLLAWGGDLHADRLIDAYSHGIFPWYEEDQPILWWSPFPRCVIYPDRVHRSRRLLRTLRQKRYRITADQAFEQVILQCAQPRNGQIGTWITTAMCQAYTKLHSLGIAHSIEVWDDQKLVGGLYGIALPPVFFGESMFSLHSNTSKMALVTLCNQLVEWDYQLFDCQISNPHLISMGSVEIEQYEFIAALEHCQPQPGNWQSQFTDKFEAGT
jgi:leucyl/phenylalanyl-tRNA--protein transferase